GVRGIPAKHVLVISDSCYSGVILAGTGRSPYVDKLQTLKSRTWMASGSKEPVPDSAPGGAGHSPFANAFLEGLSKMQDNQFTASDLFFTYVRRRVASNSPQLPQYGAIRESGDDLGDFVFARGGIAREDTAPIIKYQGSQGSSTNVATVFDP